jgi:hypothetical protein
MCAKHAVPPSASGFAAAPPPYLSLPVVPLPVVPFPGARPRGYTRDHPRRGPAPRGQRPGCRSAGTPRRPADSRRADRSAPPHQAPYGPPGQLTSRELARPECSNWPRRHAPQAPPSPQAPFEPARTGRRPRPQRHRCSIGAALTTPMFHRCCLEGTSGPRPARWASAGVVPVWRQAARGARETPGPRPEANEPRVPPR